MHGLILGVGLLAAAAACADAHGATDATSGCPRAPRALVERFIDADCAECWARVPVPPATPDAWLLDWVVPGARGDDAPLAAAAPAEATQRSQRIAAFTLDATGRSQRRTALPRTGLRLRVSAGPAWNGYFALQLDARGRWPAHSTGWLALVEVVPAGTDGTPVPRQLVRAVAGPLELDALRAGGAAQALRALRWPETAQPARLRARAWIETPGGDIVAVAGERCSVK